MGAGERPQKEAPIETCRLDGPVRYSRSQAIMSAGSVVGCRQEKFRQT
jgi:hypothetical protein